MAKRSPAPKAARPSTAKRAKPKRAKKASTKTAGPTTPPKATPDKPKATPDKPGGLGPHAEHIWNETVERYELRAHELRILEDACREVDLIERLEDELALEPSLVAEGSMGQPVASPLVQELRHHRSTYKQLIAALKLPDDEEPVPGTRSAEARRTAMARWRGTA